MLVLVLRDVHDRQCVGITAAGLYNLDSNASCGVSANASVVRPETFPTLYYNNVTEDATTRCIDQVIEHKVKHKSTCILGWHNRQ
jgi:hypothetical protein